MSSVLVKKNDPSFIRPRPLRESASERFKKRPTKGKQPLSRVEQVSRELILRLTKSEMVVPPTNRAFDIAVDAVSMLLQRHHKEMVEYLATCLIKQARKSVPGAKQMVLPATQVKLEESLNQLIYRWGDTEK